jgi:hypothetical protein
VFVVGFLISTAIAQIQGLRTESRLRIASEALFPAAQQSEQAVASFDRMTRSFADAVMLEDTAALARAAKEGQDAAALLEKASQQPGLNGERSAALANVAASVRNVLTESQAVYGPMIQAGSNITDAMQQASRRQAAATEDVKKTIAATSQQAADELRDELATSVSNSIRQRWIGIGTFLLSLVVASIVVVVAIRRSVIGTLSAVVKTLSEGSAHILSAAGQVAASAQSLSEGASEQVASLEQTSASIEEMASMTRKSAENA